MLTHSRAVRLITVLCLVLVGMASLPSAPPARAQGLSLVVSDGDINGLIRAIDLANVIPNAVIVLAENGTYALTEPYPESPSVGLPLISGTMTIRGRGSTITRAPNAPDFGLFTLRPWSDLTIEDVTLTNHRSRPGISSVWNVNGKLTLINTRVVNNNASSGGAITNQGILIVRDSTFENNTAQDGGAIYSQGGSLTVTGSVLRNNSATDGGGAIYISDENRSAHISESTFTGNNADRGGAIHSLSEATIEASTLDGNTATTSGGAIFNNSGLVSDDNIMSITNSTLSNNHAPLGGGIYNERLGRLTVTNGTISANTASQSGGGIHVTPSSTLTLVNTISAGNTSPQGPDIIGNATGRHNLIGDGAGMTGLSHGSDGNQVGSPPHLVIEPRLSPLADNGGPTRTMALMAGSPAIDTGDSAAAPQADQRGIPRPQYEASDIGAYEFADSTPPVIAANIDGTLGANGWYVSDVAVSWSVEDDQSDVTSQSGCEPATITVDTTGETLTCEATSIGGTGRQTATIRRDTVPPDITITGNRGAYGPSDVINITCVATDATSGVASDTCVPYASVPASSIAPGEHTHTITAVDGAGHRTTQSMRFVVDHTPPDITPTITGPQGTNGWYTGDVTVNWTVSDDLTDILSSTDCESTTIDYETDGTILTCTATSVGGTGSREVEIKLDATLPTITYTGNQGRYGLFDTIAITCVATDSISGIADHTCADISGPAALFAPGTHTRSAAATDMAGNTATATTSFVVGATHDELCRLTQQVVRQPVLANAACLTLAIARLAERAGSPVLERAALASYELQIRVAIARRSVSQTDGSTLLTWARTL